MVVEPARLTSVAVLIHWLTRCYTSLSINCCASGWGGSGDSGCSSSSRPLGCGCGRCALFVVMRCGGVKCGSRLQQNRTRNPTPTIHTAMEISAIRPGSMEEDRQGNSYGERGRSRIAERGGER